MSSVFQRVNCKVDEKSKLNASICYAFENHIFHENLVLAVNTPATVIV